MNVYNLSAKGAIVSSILVQKSCVVLTADNEKDFGTKFEPNLLQIPAPRCLSFYLLYKMYRYR